VNPYDFPVWLDPFRVRALAATLDSMPTVIGRDAELRQVAAYLERIKGGPASLLVSGDPGVGKTTLWEAVVADARRQGLRVLEARGSQAESGLTFSGLTDLLADVTDAEIAELPRQQRTALAAALLRAEVEVGRHDHRAVSAATLTLLRLMSVRSPVLLAIDDFHWCDRPTARIVEYVARRLDHDRIGVLCSQRPPGPGGGSSGLAGTLRREHADLLELAPLDEDSIVQIAQASAASTGQALSLRHARHICALAGGNPLFAVELSREPHTEGLPTTLRELVRARVRSFPAGTRELLLLVATLRQPTVPQVADAAGSPVDATFVALEAAADNGVLLPLAVTAAVRFEHPLYAAGVRALASRPARRRAHLQAAQVVRDPEERAWHLALAATGPDDDLARQLEDAGERAMARGAPEAACDLTRHALRLTPVDQAEATFRRAVTIAELQFQAGEIPAARDALEELLVNAITDDQRARVLRLLGELLYHQDNFADAARSFTKALELDQDPDNRAHILVHLAFVTVSLGRFEDAARNAAAALRLVAHIQSSGLHASVLGTYAITRYLIGYPVDETLVSRSLQLEDPNYPILMTLRPSLIAGHLRLYEGRLTEAAALLSAALADAVERGNESDVNVVAAALSWAHWWHCDLERAGALIEEAVEVADRLQSGPGRCVAYAYGSVQRAFAGDLSTAQATAERALQVADNSGYEAVRLWAWWALAVAGIQTGETASAHTAVESLLEAVDVLGLPTPVRVMALADAIEILIGAGDLDRASTHIDILAESATRTGTEWAIMQAHRCRAHHLAASGDLDHAWAQITQALGHCETHELVVESARTRLAAGQIARRRRRRRDAEQLLELALASFEAGGASGFAALTAAELRRVRPGASAPGELTPTELRVAELAAAGLTNRRVASQLNISPKTVEANLARVYRKLQIASRAELGAHFGAEPH
jgi:DNA-binding CsgD family transcriptional regulator